MRFNFFVNALCTEDTLRAGIVSFSSLLFRLRGVDFLSLSLICDSNFSLNCVDSLFPSSFFFLFFFLLITNTLP